MPNQYAYSTDQEMYHDSFDTKEEAIAEGSSCIGANEVFYVGKHKDAMSYVTFDFGEQIIEQLGCQMADNLNADVCDDWLCGELGDKIAKLIDDEVGPIVEKIVREHDLPTFWGITDVETYDSNGNKFVEAKDD